MVSLFIFLYLQFIQSSCEEFGKYCSQCSDSECTQCTAYYGIDKRSKSSTKGQCIKCQSYGCEKCNDDAEKCTQCGSGYLDKDSNSKTYGKCISCGEYCWECNETDKCTKCIPFFPSGFDGKGNCKSCEDPECSTCSKDYRICESCRVYSNLGADLDSSSSTYGKCIKPKDPKCKIPSLSDASKCTECADGYYMNDNKECVDCDAGEHCIACSSSTYCTKCEAGYYVSGGSCNKCTVENCIRCYRANECNECINGYELKSSNNDECVDTEIPNCKHLERNGQCKTCNAGYGVDNNKKCTECKVKDCALCSEDYTKCTECKDENLNFNVEKGQCEEGCAREHCLNCEKSDNSKCTKCEDGYSGTECKPCEDENCIDCRKGIDKCDECDEGYYLSRYKCIAIGISNCIAVSYSDTCTKCAEGYTVDDGECVKCENEECANCYGFNGICSECKEGYEVDFNKGSSSYGYCRERSDSDGSKSKLPLGAIIGIAVGGVVVVGLIIFLIVYFVKCRKAPVGGSSSQ
ncbi:hypothetical protein M9Y10_014556 [Tritrichomonas musculus]|uniref:CXXC-rich protein n=1 Tax=Tritrichomonas musculus TaxID=1915356 RepID=A0ABR2KZY1_9EUKA